MKSEEINLDNYGAFYIDYIEGRLDPLGTAELLLFFEQNPQLKEEAFQISGIYLKPEPGIAFGFSESLIQPADTDAAYLNTENYDHYFIAANEGDLSVKGLKAVESFILQHPELRNEYNLYNAARLKPDLRLKLGSKSKLRKPVGAGIRRLIYYGAAAATIFILISVYLRLEPVSDTTLVNTIGGTEKTGQITPDLPISKPAGSDTQPNSKTVPVKKKVPVKKSVKNTSNENTGSAPAARDDRSINKMKPRLILNTTAQTFVNLPRSLYSGIYDDISLSQEIMLAALENQQTDQNAYEVYDEMESMAKFKTGRRMGSLFRSGAQIASQIPENLNGWMLADLGISGMNLLTDNELKLQRSINPEGKAENIRLTEGGQSYSLRRNRN